jgi:hypothetical protein
MNDKTKYLEFVGERKRREPAMLDCQGSPSCGRWVIHTFKNVLTMRDEADQLNSTKAEIYECCKCKAERMWGHNNAWKDYRHEESPSD